MLLGLPLIIPKRALKEKFFLKYGIMEDMKRVGINMVLKRKKVSNNRTRKGFELGLKAVSKR